MNVLFVCNGNVARSQEAELFFNTFRSNKADIAKSAGINVKLGKPIDPLVVEVMNEDGYNVSGAERKLVDKASVEKADLIISFKSADELPDYIREHSNIRFWTVPDPQHQSIEFHREVRDTVARQVQELIKELNA